MERRGIYRKGNVEIYIERSPSEICVIKKLIVNGVQERPYIFGHTKDIEPNVKACGCGNRVFIPNERFFNYKMNALRYNLRPEDMDDLKALLVETLSIGYCPRCR
jgi:hypothetical protein